MPSDPLPAAKPPGAKARLLAIPFVLVVLAAYFGTANWYGHYRAGAVCDQARAARSADEFRAHLKAQGAPWHEGLRGSGETQFVITYPGSMMDGYACKVNAVGNQVTGMEVSHTD
ncbi:MAG TPA: hypothetical protein VH105_25445 [Burkholderiales bacterium]|jgi:hypothetical protein|nr:hypothetical protein [Burkholderiales bacterium]